MICPKCGEPMEEKNTIDIAEEKTLQIPIAYVCPGCGHSEYEDYKPGFNKIS